MVAHKGCLLERIQWHCPWDALSGCVDSGLVQVTPALSFNTTIE